MLLAGMSSQVTDIFSSKLIFFKNNESLVIHKIEAIEERKGEFSDTFVTVFS